MTIFSRTSHDDRSAADAAPTSPRGGDGSWGRAISRRALLGRGAGLAGALGALVGASPALAGGDTRVWKLVTSKACKSCHACKAHGHHKLFATSAAADDGRAHRGCRCRVRRTRKVSVVQRQKLFGEPGNLKRTMVDTRWDWVERVLAPSSSGHRSR